MSNFNEIRRMNLEIQERKLELQETNAWARANELMVKEK
jgi:AmiR/NasT family two-component response regulator